MVFYKYYDRFGKTLEITTGTDYPDTEVVFYARDFGAVGDGVTNDGLPYFIQLMLQLQVVNLQKLNLMKTKHIF